MKRALLGIVGVAAAFAAIDLLADMTQDRPDRVLPGSRSEIVLDDDLL